VPESKTKKKEGKSLKKPCHPGLGGVLSAVQAAVRAADVSGRELRVIRLSAELCELISLNACQ